MTLGGAAATDVSVSGSDVITARTPTSAVAGPVDITVTASGRTSTLTGGYRYETSVPNTPPVIRSMTAQGRRPRQPALYADYGETIQVSVVVEDAESAAAQLGYQWRPCGGIIAGTGPQVEWTAPTGGTLPSTCTIEVTISDGPHIQTRSVVVRLHNAPVELAALAIEFLTEFANSTIPAETTVRNFSDEPVECRNAKADELSEVQNNRKNYRIDAYTYGDAIATINFGGICAFRSRPADACIATPVEWKSTKLDTQTPEVTIGISQITGVYQNSRWRLCRSEIQSLRGSGTMSLY